MYTYIYVYICTYMYIARYKIRISVESHRCQQYGRQRFHKDLAREADSVRCDGIADADDDDDDNDAAGVPATFPRPATCQVGAYRAFPHCTAAVAVTASSAVAGGSLRLAAAAPSVIEWL